MVNLVDALGERRRERECRQAKPKLRNNYLWMESETEKGLLMTYIRLDPI
jgi:hypothetical protein